MAMPHTMPCHRPWHATKKRKMAVRGQNRSPSKAGHQRKIKGGCKPRLRGSEGPREKGVRGSSSRLFAQGASTSGSWPSDGGKLWPHASLYSCPKLDNLWLAPYSCPELEYADWNSFWSCPLLRVLGAAVPPAGGAFAARGRFKLLRGNWFGRRLRSGPG